MKNKTTYIILNRKKLYIAVIVFLLCITIWTLFYIRNKNDSSTTSSKGQSLKELLFNEHKIKGRIAIIIDDFGNNGEGTEEMLKSINRPLTCAVMPFMPNTKEEANLAHEMGHEVIIHIPMEPHRGNPNWLGPKGITTLLSTEHIKDIITEAIEEVPFAVGVNNHMGSKATEDKRVIRAIVEVLKDKNMYIVDSKTSPNSVIREIAEELGVIVYERDVFLDNKKDLLNVKKQIKTLELIAEKNKIAIGIGHVGPEGGNVTAKAIKDMITEIESMGLEIVPVSKLRE